VGRVHDDRTQVNNAVLLESALSYAAEGLPIFPCKPWDKKPYVEDWPNVATTDLKQIREWWTRWPEASIGMVTGYRSGRFVLDIDPRHGGDKSLAVIEEQYGALPPTLEVETGGGGRHLHFQLRGLNIHNSEGDLAPGLDIRGVGGYVLLPPSVHPSGHRYGFVNGNKVLDQPEWLEKRLLELKSTPPTSTNGTNRTSEKIPTGRRNRWLVGQAGRYRRSGDDPETIYRKLLVDYELRCEHVPPVEDKELRAIAQWADRFTPEPERETAGPAKANIPPAEPETQSCDLTIVGSGREDTSNAQRFTAQHRDSVRYWHGRNRWVLWTKTHWHDDALARVVELAKETAKQILVEASQLPEDECKKMARWAERSLNRDKINSMLALAQSDPKIATTTEKWDRDPWVLNFLNGTVDLRTGELRPHRKEDFITKVVRCNYVPELVGPRWLHFVHQTFGDLADWIQKAVGYTLTGVTSEKAAFLLWGPTDTGKTTFLTTLREVFADYSTLIQIDTLMWSKNVDNNTNADLADLRGARLAVTSETEEGQRLREAKLKKITQGMGEIKAIRKYENPILFNETHKLWLDCNHQPIIHGADDAIWNRIIPIPCTHQVKDAEKDNALKSKLLHEADAIASWTVKGAIRWQSEGLGRPSLILETRARWREDMDTIGQFVTECCEQQCGSSARAGELYEAFKSWSIKQGYEHVMTLTAFGLRLVDRGFQKDKDRKGRFYCGLSLKGGLF